MSSSVTPTPTEDAAALERVRNRLASSPDAKLPLSKLLPRLVSRFYAATNDEQVMNSHLIGILEHVRERCLLNPKLIQLDWIEPLLKALLPPEGLGEHNAKMALCWTRQLQHTLPILELAALKGVPHSECLLPQLMTILEGLHVVLPILCTAEGRKAISRIGNGQQNANNPRTENEMEMANDGGEAQATTSDESFIKHNLQRVWEHASWIVVEQIAKASNLSPVLDWNLLGDDWDELNTPTSLKKIQEYEATHDEQESAGPGIFQLLLKAITFDPADAARNYSGPNLNDSLWQFRRQSDSIKEDFEHAQRQRNAQHELARRNQIQLVRRDVSRRSHPTEWNPYELQYWRGLQRCLTTYAIRLFDGTEREGILRVVTGQLKPPSPLALQNRIKPSEMRKINARKRAKAVMTEQNRFSCSLAEEMALLHLILGDVVAQPILMKHKQDGSWRHLDLLGKRTNDSSSQLPSVDGLRPLPQAMAQRVFSHLLRADLHTTTDTQVDDKSLGLFLELVSQVNTAPSLRVTLSMEVYDKIGAHTPPSLCWPVHFLWQLIKQLSKERSRLPPVLGHHSYNAAIELLDKLHDSSLQRFERRARLALERNSLQRRIDEHREKQSDRHPFVMEALEARSEAYQMVTRFLTKDKVMDDNHVISWDQAVRILNCVAFDQSADTSTPLRETSMKVTSLYFQVLTEHRAPENQKAIPPINPLLLPLLKACISASEWSREVAIHWAVEIVSQIDPCISQTILACLASDEVPLVATKASEALKKLSFPVIKNVGPSEATIVYLNLDQSRDRAVVAGDLRSRILSLTTTHHGLSTKAANQVLQKFDFSVEAASTALEDSKVDQVDDSMVVDGEGPAEIIDTRGDLMDLDQSSDSTCQVCLDEIASSEGFSLMCGHAFCRDCWHSGLELVAESPSFKELATFSCLRHDCDERMTQEDVEKIAPNLAPAFQDATLKWFVLSSPNYTFCPGPECTVVACRQGAARPQQADCQLCSTSFCFGCGHEPHSPAACSVKKRFVTATERLKAHEHSVEYKTIACPSCGIGITKNGGCNHMTCSQCGHEFCWICLSANWQDHVCNVYDSFSGVNDLERIQFFRRRVEAHLTSSEATQRLLKKFDEKARELKSHSRFCQDAHLYILKEAWKVVVMGRKYLADSYIAAYGMGNTCDASVRHEFEAHQSQLQLFVEQLSLLSDSVPSLYETDRELDFQVKFRGLHFCTVAVTGYIQRIESCVDQYLQGQSL